MTEERHNAENVDFYRQGWPTAFRAGYESARRGEPIPDGPEPPETTPAEVKEYAEAIRRQIDENLGGERPTLSDDALSMAADVVEYLDWLLAPGTDR